MEPRGPIAAKNKGEIEMFWVIGAKSWKIEVVERSRFEVESPWSIVQSP
jgi:hypothetical protein